MYRIERTNTFKKSFKRCLKRGLNPALFESAIRILQENGKLPPKYKPHKLSSKQSGTWECHIQPDWLLVWRQDDELLTLLLIDTGTHSDLFG